jgi:hypothetical protein
VVVQNAVTAELVKHHAPVVRDADRVREVPEIGQLEVDVGNASCAVPVAGGVDLDAVGREEPAAMVDRKRKRRAVEIRRPAEPQIHHEAEEPVGVVVGVDGREVVRARPVAEVRPGWLGRGRGCEDFEVLNGHIVAAQGLIGSRRRSGEARQRHGGSEAVERCLGGRRTGGTAGGQRIASKDGPVHIGAEGAQVQDLAGLDIDHREPRHQPARRGYDPEHDLPRDPERAVRNLRRPSQWKRELQSMPVLAFQLRFALVRQTLVGFVAEHHEAIGHDLDLSAVGPRRFPGERSNPNGS